MMGAWEFQDAMIDKKIKDRLIGVVTATVVAIVTFLVSTYFSSFVTRADYNKDMQVVEVIKSDLAYIKSTLSEIKDHLKKH